MPLPLTSPPRRTPGVVFERTAHRSVRSAGIWGYVCAAFVVSSTVAYSSTYKTLAERRHLAAIFSTNRASAAMFGPAPALQTVPGFVQFKTLLSLSVIAAVWAITTSTAATRGEEDSGRWEILLSGPTTARRATGAALAGLGVAVAALWALLGAILVLFGRYGSLHVPLGPALLMATSVAGTAAVYMAAGAVTAQLAPNRRRAAAWAGWILGVGYGLRMVADAGPGLHWLIWLSPLGWAEQSSPFVSPSPWCLLPMGVVTFTFASLTILLSGRRDLGEGIVAEHEHPAVSVRPGGVWSLSWRSDGPTMIGWGAGLVACGLAFGLVARSAGSTMTGSSMAKMLARIGATGGGLKAFMGVAFLIVALMTGLAAAGRCTAMREEEESGRLDQILSRPVERYRWLAAQVASAALSLVVMGAVASLAAWAGTAFEGGGLSLGSTLASGLNAVLPAWIILAAGTACLGFWPRGLRVVIYALLVWSTLVEIVGATGPAGRWLMDTSLLRQAAAASPSGGWAVTGLAVAVALIVLGTVGLSRRDLQGE